MRSPDCPDHLNRPLASTALFVRSSVPPAGRSPLPLPPVALQLGLRPSAFSPPTLAPRTLDPLTVPRPPLRQPLRPRLLPQLLPNRSHLLRLLQLQPRPDHIQLTDLLFTRLLLLLIGQKLPPTLGQPAQGMNQPHIPLGLRPPACSCKALTSNLLSTSKK